MAIDYELLSALAAKYVWWASPEEATKRPARIVAHVMNIGDYDDVQTLAKAAGDGYLRHVLEHAEAGQFSPRSWAYWHYRLDMTVRGAVPPLPLRRVS